jgi:uncharacterized protein
MHVVVNLRHLEERTIQLAGEVPPEEMGYSEFHDELVEVAEPLHYDVEVEKQNENLYVHGRLWVTLNLTCKRCLKQFKQPLELDPYHGYVPLEGEEAAPVTNDLVDLTPYFREDTLLAFPQHPLCSEDCKGIATASGSKAKGPDLSLLEKPDKATWSALDKLKF